MVDAVTAIVAAVIAGLAGGFLHSWMTFNASGEKFDGRKHGNALIVGALTGMALGLATVLAYDVMNKSEIPAAPFAVALFGIFLAAAGIDTVRSKASAMIANRQAATTAAKTATTTTTTKTTETKPPPP
jgi:hypothetical protein